MSLENSNGAVCSLVMPPAKKPDPTGFLREEAERALDQLTTPFDSERAVFMLNFTTNNVKRDGGASTLAALEIDEHTLSLAALLGTKGIVTSNGRCIVGRKFAEQVRNFTDYTDSIGLTSGAFQNIIFVDDVHDVKTAVSVIAAMGKEVEFYFANSASVGLAKEQGAIQQARDTGSFAVDLYGNKSLFRNEMDRVVRDLTGGSLFDFERAIIQHDPAPSPTEIPALHFKLEQMLEYYPYSSTPHPEQNKKLFVQVVDAAGGQGNIVVSTTKDGKLTYKDLWGEVHTVKNSSGLLDSFIKVFTAKGLDLEITPFLREHQPYSYSIMIADDVLVIIGPRKTFVDPAGTGTIGSTTDRIICPDEFSDFERNLLLMEHYGRTLHSANYRNHAGVDLIDYLAADGQRRSILGESNVRRDAGTFILAAILKFPETREVFFRGELSYLIDDHIHVPEEVYYDLKRRYGQGASALIGHLKNKGEELFSSRHQRGLVLLSPPHIVEGEGITASFGVIDTDDQRKYDRHLRLKAHFLSAT